MKAYFAAVAGGDSGTNSAGRSGLGFGGSVGSVGAGSVGAGAVGAGSVGAVVSGTVDIVEGRVTLPGCAGSWATQLPTKPSTMASTSSKAINFQCVASMAAPFCLFLQVL